MNKLDKDKTGLIVGTFFAVLHAAWALAVAVMPGALQAFLDWVFKVHFLQPIYVLTMFNLVDAIKLIAITFVVGYAFGWVFAWVHNSLHKKK